MAAANPISQTGDRADNTTDTSAAGATNFQEPAPATSSKNADAVSYALNNITNPLLRCHVFSF